MKAKPTVYNGVHFRSRLEAKWAVFFDAIQEPWVYEPVVPETEGVYVPDFWMPNRHALVEIKPLIPGESDCWALIGDDWSDRTELYERACAGNRQMFVIFGAPGEWGNGRLIGSGHEAAHFWFTGRLQTHFPFIFGECPSCGNIWLFADGQADCCRTWLHGDVLDSAITSVRDHSYEDPA